MTPSRVKIKWIVFTAVITICYGGPVPQSMGPLRKLLSLTLEKLEQLNDMETNELPSLYMDKHLFQEVILQDRYVNLTAVREIIDDVDSNSSRSKADGRAMGGFLKSAMALLDIKQVIKEIETSVMSSVSCTACKAGVGLLQHYIQTRRSQEEITSAVVKVCVRLKIETPRVCNGIIPLFSGELIYVMQSVVLTPDEVCGLLLGDVCSTPISPYHYWLISLPPIPKPIVIPPTIPSPSQPTMKILHLSDTHLDMEYAAGSNAMCGEPLCCRKSSGRAKTYKNSAGPWGDYRKCDTPPQTLYSMLNHIVNTHKDIDLIYWTGDLPPHDVWNQSKSSNIAILRETVRQMTQFFPNTPVFPALGNHEAAPVNSFPPPLSPARFSVDWLYDELDKQWSHWLPFSASSTVRYGAYYSVLVHNGFRVISINTNYCNNKNWWLLLNSTDPARELQWLAYELQAAEFQQEKVHIIGHIPPGYADCLRVWSYNYYRIVNRYESTISAQFFGHTHFDEFEVFYDLNEVNRPVSIAYVGPSVTPYSGLNPGYRIYVTDGDYPASSRLVLDHETWIMDLVRANRLNYPEWTKLYSALEAYGMPSALPEDWDVLAHRIANDQTLFDLFYRFYWKGSPAREACDDACRSRLICDLVSGRSHDRKQTCQVLEHSLTAAADRRHWSSTLFNGMATMYVIIFACRYYG